MNGPQFLESLVNLASQDYMHSRREVNPAFFLNRLSWLAKIIPGLPAFLEQAKFIHITGTSGKGTVGAMIQSILAQAGYKVGFYNSPHVQNIYERMRVLNGKTLFQSKGRTATNDQPLLGKKIISPQLYDIPPPAFDQLTQWLKPYLELAILESPYGLPSYFEIMVILGLLYFQQEKCDYLILEVGCGGRYDATNIIPQSCLAIITTIGYDHEHLIGPTRLDIAGEKSGIIKKNGTALIGPTIKGKILQKIQQEACRKQATLIATANKKDRPDFINQYLIDQPGGAHGNKNKNVILPDFHNELISVKAAQILEIPTEIIKRGLQQYRPLPGRFDIIKRQPTIIGDGAHNPDKVKFLLAKLQAFSSNQRGKYQKILIFSSVDTKNWRVMLKLLIPHFDKIYLTRHTVSIRKSANLKSLYQYARRRSKQVRIFISPDDAWQTARQETKKNDLILITGSLYLVGYLKNLALSSSH